jgi:arsenate reductase
VRDLLVSRGVEFDTVHYLTDPPTRDKLGDLVERLIDEPADLVRKDARFTKLALTAADYTEPAEVVAILAEHIELLQRPLLDDGNEVFIGRPPKTVEAWLAGRI